MLIHPSRHTSVRRSAHHHRPSLPPVYEMPNQHPIPMASPRTSYVHGKQVETQISIIVTTWDDEGKCWYPVEAHGPIERELRRHAERKRRERSQRVLEEELGRERT